MEVEYKGFYFKEGTPQEVMDIITSHYDSNDRLLFSYGDVDTGRDWQEVYDIEGYVGRSTGKKPIPILVYNSLSLGGPSILAHCTVRIQYAKGKKVLYEHPFYHKEEKELVDKMSAVI
jgi:hypothetical protein